MSYIAPSRRPLLALTLAALLAGCGNSQPCAPRDAAARAAFAAAWQRRDAAALAALARTQFPAATAPAPESAERFEPLPAPAPERPLAAATAAWLAQAQAMAWWQRQPPPPPAQAPAPLRAPARLARNLVALAAVDPAVRADALALATSAADHLLAASAGSGFAGAPFPDWREREGRLGDLVRQALARQQRCQPQAQPLRGGWLVLADQPAEYFFDSGLAGEALVAVHGATNLPRFRAGALRAGQWAQAQAISPNWNYNAFIASFFVALHRMTGEAAWLDRAAERARLGIIPGMLTGGADAGHWRDPHNERIAYRAIMARALVMVAGALAAAGPDRRAEAAAMAVAAQQALSALEVQMDRSAGVTSPAAMAELYAALAEAQAAGAAVHSVRPALRAAILAGLRQRAGDRRLSPDSGFGEALALAPRPR